MPVELLDSTTRLRRFVVVVTAVDGDVGSALSKRDRSGCADSLSASCDKGYFVLKIYLGFSTKNVR